MKYVIDIPEGKEDWSEDGMLVLVKLNSGITLIARPLSELCEEEAKKIEKEHNKYDGDVHGEDIAFFQATALRSFGSKQ